ncbi:hypothetical protein KP509_26G041900, partial [Ceratopteris richardii]
IINHVVPLALHNQIKDATRHFFSLPTEVQSELLQADPFSPLSHTIRFKPYPYMNTKLLPCILREPFLNFREKVGSLAHGIAKEILACLQINADLLSDTRIRRQTMTINYYPCFPDRKFNYGIRPHPDFGSITLSMQDEILTNGMYKRIEHRVLTNRYIPRISIACFYAPTKDDDIGPLGKFVSKRTPLMYKAIQLGDALNHGFNRPLNKKSNLLYSAIN